MLSVMKKTVTQIIVATFALFLLSTCGERGTLLSIAAGPTGGSWHPVGGVIGNVINKYVPGIRVNVESTEGGVQNVRLLGTHEADIGMSIAATALNGYRGETPYQQSFTNIRTLIASFQLGYLQMVVLEDSDMQSVEDIEGKRVVLGPPGHGAIPRQREVYQEMGISFEDFTPVYLPFRDSLQSLGDRRVDASVVYMAQPSPSLLEFAVTNEFRMLPVSEEYRKQVIEKYPYFLSGTVAKDVYGLSEDVPTLATSSVILVREEISEELVYQIVKAILEHVDEVQATHPSMEGFSSEMSVLGPVVPFHKGAERYFKEVGLLE
jgi:TRAP transporter TAXI family solute receptor